jgi:molybdopterin/thiamine biosynthesis adenylyltransferase
MNEEYYLRQTDLAHPDNLKMKIGIVGAGGIGSWTCLALAKMGCSALSIYDHDNVEVQNLGAQFYESSDLNTKKVDALRRRVENLTDVKIEAIPLRIRDTMGEHHIVISAVDNMATRKNIFDNLKAAWLIDGRMAGNEIHIFTIKNIPDEKKKYEETLFTDQEAEHTPCSSRAVVYNTLVIAGLITDQVAMVARGETPPFETIVDLRNLKMYS